MNIGKKIRDSLIGVLLGAALHRGPGATPVLSE